MKTPHALLNPQALLNYFKDHNVVHYEHGIIAEIQQLLDSKDISGIEWFTQFGKSIRAIIFNVHAYRRGLLYGFTSITLDEYGWLTRPNFLDQEELKFGLADKERFGNYSTITLGRGLNQKWTFGMSISYGTAGSSSGLSVYDEVFESRQAALRVALAKLKSRISTKVGDSDTTNYNQKILLATLKEIEQFKIGESQLTLF